MFEFAGGLVSGDGSTSGWEPVFVPPDTEAEVGFPVIAAEPIGLFDDEFDIDRLDADACLDQLVSAQRPGTLRSRLRCG
jgi:hypothetical protein